MYAQCQKIEARKLKNLNMIANIGQLCIRLREMLLSFIYRTKDTFFFINDASSETLTTGRIIHLGQIVHQPSCLHAFNVITHRYLIYCTRCTFGITIVEFLIDNIFVIFGGCVFQQTVGIPMGTNCAPLLADLFLYLYQADFKQGLLKKNEKKLSRSFNFTFHYIVDVLGDFVDHIYPIEL